MEKKLEEVQQKEKAYVFFDGLCNFCNGSVRFIIKRDPKARFSFAPLSSDKAKELLKSTSAQTDSLPDSILLVQDGKLYTQAKAALKIATQLNGLWPLFGIFTIVPTFILNPIYDFIARNRYKWFGKKETCPMPTPEIRERFLATS